jgi:hypothetical protein
MPNMNDFHAFKSCSGGTDGAGCGMGCLSPTVIIVAIILFVIYLIGKLG